MQEESTDKTDLLKDFAWRLSSRAEKADLSQAAIAERLGVTPSWVGNWFQARHMPLKREREQLAKLLGTSVEWLLTGTGPVEVAQGPVLLAAPQFREVPVISWTHAGIATSYAEMPRHWHGTVATTSRDKKAFALTIEGECMEPKFFAGDRVILEPASEPRTGKPVVAKLADSEEVMLRIYTQLDANRIRLTALKSDIYPPKEYPLSAFSWIYPVRELVRSV